MSGLWIVRGLVVLGSLGKFIIPSSKKISQFCLCVLFLLCFASCSS